MGKQMILCVVKMELVTVSTYIFFFKNCFELKVVSGLYEKKIEVFVVPLM